MNTVTIILKAKYHALIIFLLQDKSRVDAINYINQVAKAVGANYDPEADISVNVPNDLVIYCYTTIGAVSERLVAADNRDIKTALLPQLSGDLLQKIIDITTANAADTETIRAQGVSFIQSIIV
jgi:hypothetical protein